jgi:hypothetical protein
MIRMLTWAVLFLLAALIAAPAHSEKTKVGKIRKGEICFTGSACVDVGSGDGELGEGPFAGAGEWIVEVYNDTGKTIAKVGAGGDIIVLSPQAYAHRGPGKKTYTIERFDRKTKPVKTDFVAIATHPNRTGWGYWGGPGIGAVGMTALPGRENIDAGEILTMADRFRTRTRGRLWVGGTITGITPEGTLTQSYTDVAAVQLYGDFNVLMFKGGKEHQVTDDSLRAVMPRTDAIVAFTPAFPDQPSSYSDNTNPAIDYPRIMFGVPRGELGNGETLYHLLPRKRGASPPKEFLGVQPMRSWKWPTEQRPLGLDEGKLEVMTAGWAGVWAGRNGPEMTFLNFDGTQADAGRYKSVAWGSGGMNVDAGVLENFDGTARQIVPTLTWIMPDFAVAPQMFTSKQAALDDIRQRAVANQEAYWAEVREASARAEAERAKRESDMAYWKAQEEKRNQEYAALEDYERSEAQAIMTLSPDQWSEACNRAAALVTFYASNDALAYCASIKPQPVYQAAKQDFWGSLASALDAWATAAEGAAIDYPSSPPPGAAPDWDYARAMKSIDNTVTQVTDPNWNGAATRASQR